MLRWSWQCINISWSLFYLNAFFFLPCMLMAVFKSVDCIKRWDKASALKRRSDKNLRSFVGPAGAARFGCKKDWQWLAVNVSKWVMRHHDSVHINTQSWSNLHPINTQKSKSGESTGINEWILVGHEQYLSTRLNCGLSDTFLMHLLECGVVYMCALAGWMSLWVSPPLSNVH